MFNKIFDLFSKVDQALSQAQRMQGTVDRAENQATRVSQAGSNKVKWVILIGILVLAALYVFFGS